MTVTFVLFIVFFATFNCIHVPFPFKKQLVGDSSQPFWGVTQVNQYNNVVASQTYGYTSYTHDTEMSSNQRFPIGSNTKLFTSIGIYQLQEQGLLDVNDDISLYLDESDFKAFGFPNITSYCPILYGDQTNKCQKITFVNLLSMSSGILRSLNCGYGPNSYFTQFCWDLCSVLWLYNGTFADYIGTFINVPLTFIPATQYDYSNDNFILAGYIIEKLSGLKFSDYIQKYILDVLNMKDTYFDEWTGYFGQHKNRVDLWLLIRDSTDLNVDLGVGWCEPVLSDGISGSSGGIVATTNDLILLYQDLFNENTMPKIFVNESSRDAIIAPVTLIDESESIYYAQGIVVTYNMSISTSWPIFIQYEGGTFCSNTAIKMIPDSTQTIVTAFSNAPRMLVHSGENGLNYLRNNVNMNNCEMLVHGLYSLDDGGANQMAQDLIDQYM